MVLVKKWPFSKLFFLGNIGGENIFWDILRGKNAFLGYKQINKTFQKGDITHGFDRKIVIFPTFFF